MPTIPVRRSLHNALQQAAHIHRTDREIQTNTYALMNIHKRTLMNDWMTLGVALGKMEDLLQKCTSIPTSIMATHQKLCEELRLMCYEYYWTAYNMIETLDENMLIRYIPCVSFMRNLRMRVQSFVKQLKYDTNDDYMMRMIYPVFCKRLLKEIEYAR
jgi:hypothetical protein